MKDIMLDLETLGTGNNGAVVEIGAVGFDPRGAGIGPNATFRRRITLESAMRYGDVDAGTLLWWLQQSEAARTAVFLDPNEIARPLDVALDDFSAWLEGPNEIAMWGNGATFDNIVIRSAYRAVGKKVPWSFRQDKCYRTVINLLPESRRPKFERVGMAHSAVDDAVTQALHLQKVYKELSL
jgi:exodeoxyribonuclease VIII